MFRVINSTVIYILKKLPDRMDWLDLSNNNFDAFSIEAKIDEDEIESDGAYKENILPGGLMLDVRNNKIKRGTVSLTLIENIDFKFTGDSGIADNALDFDQT